MIRRLRIRHFRGLRDVDLRLAPLTILVGPNASGKSSILKAIAWPQGDGVSMPRDSWRHRTETGPSLEGDFGEKLFKLDVNSWHERPYSRQYLHLDLERMRSPNQVGEAKQLAPDGSNLANVFGTIPRRRQDEIAQELSRLIPVVADVNARPAPGHRGDHRLVFQDRWDPAVWYEPDEVSDGTMLVTAFLTLQHQDPPPQVVAIEEPDRGLHPFLLSELLAFLRRLSSGEIGSRPMQIIVATHSPQMLEFARPEEVRFLKRSGEDVVVEEAPTTTPEWQNVFREYQESLGTLWLSGGLGGVPSAQ